MSSVDHAPRASTRRLRLALAAAATLAVTAYTALQTDDAALPLESSAATPPRGPRPAAAAAKVAAIWPDPPRVGARPAWPAATPLGVAAWGPPASASAPASVSATKLVAAAPPQAPPFPYTLIGRLDDGEPRALLSGARRSLGAKAADVIDGDWRVDAVTPQGVTLTWLPGGIKKTITFGAT
jgi:hypothetical protein